MNICLIEDFFPPTISGGASVYVGRLADDLSKRGHTIHVITTRAWRGWRSLFFQSERRDAITIHSIYPWLLNIPNYTGQVRWYAKVWTLLMFIFNPFIYWQYIHLLRRLRPEVVHTHDTIYLSQSIFPAIRYTGIPHVHTGHFLHLLYPNGLQYRRGRLIERAVPRWWRQTGMPIVRRIIGSPQLVIGISNFYLQTHRLYGFFLHSKTSILPTIQPDAQVSHHSISDRPLRLLYIGRLDPEKGVDNLIQAVHALPTLPLTLDICGSGRMEDQLRAQASNDRRITFHGYQRGQALEQLYQHSHLLALPSLAYEIFPLSVVDALAHGLPVIATRIGGIPEVVADQKNGLLYEPGNINELTACLRRVTEDPAWLKELTRNAATFRVTHSERDFLTRLEHLYSSVQP